ncbi:D-alanyl-D-alanine carboxypeptidase family protein [Bacillus paramycoides]|uniref:D-alanyl-D-alanine carboxypeptidase family protein n=1 Tax=Bacillus paramycoides TaxID=2026194 RepID=UPI002E1C48ED|nr:D-alanyl-D-alanine carboxypeptidase family protein [Bacillus paramycoides]
MPVNRSGTPQLENHDMSLERKCMQQLLALLEACKAMDDIVVVSAYRSRAEQQELYENSLRENGAVFTSSYVARPDESEHQTGLAVDVGENIVNVDFICPSFPDQGVCQTFKRLAAEYGFIQRYKDGKEHITNIACEPWHFRYVGFPHSVIMEQQGLCLEEYIDFLKQYRFGREHLLFEQKNSVVEIYYVPVKGEFTAVPIINGGSYLISGNNKDGFVVTVFH